MDRPAFESMNNLQNSQTDWRNFVDQQVHSMVNQEMLPLHQRIMELEGCLVYVKNFLPLSLKQHAESVLFGKHANETRPR